ncbi:MAG: hypothetical protein QOG03_2359 [Actinomycetota bacterium]|jgi:hypothetical protein|nr:hypothetical protein [Actinomycetota bacterium]
MGDAERPSAADFAWLAFVVLVAAGLVASFGRMLYLIATRQQLRALVPLPIGLVSAGVLMTVAWRKTCWSRRTSGAASTSTSTSAEPQ